MGKTCVFILNFLLYTYYLPCSPLGPSTCQSVTMRFIALSPGIHTIDGMVLTDLDLNESTNLRFVYFHLSFLKAHHLLVIINLVDLLWIL